MLSLSIHKTQAIPRGPQPRNTLSASNRNRQLDKIQRPLPKDESPKSNIQVVVSMGDNVRTSARESKEHTEFEGPPAKRRKKASTPLDESSQITGSDGIDELSLQQDLTPSLARDSRRTSQSTSKPSHGDDGPKSYFNTQEYHNVENTMNSNPSGRRRGKSQYRKSSAGNPNGASMTLCQNLKHSSAADPIDLSDNEPEQQPIGLSVQLPRYQGTASEAHTKYFAAKEVLEKHPIQGTGTRSRYFDQAMPSKASPKTPLPEIAPKDFQSELQDRRDRLDSKFRATNGKPRSRDFASSPDVLTADTTVGTAPRNVSPCKSSSSTRKGSPMKEGTADLPPSNIPRTAFSGGSRTKTGLAGHVSPAHEAEPAWGVRLAAVNSGAQAHKSTTLGLQYKPEVDTYNVVEGGTDWTIQDKSYCIRPALLRKVTWSLDDGRIRFEFARREGAENILDIELSYAKDVQTLTNKLQEGHHHFRIKGESGYVNPCLSSPQGKLSLGLTIPSDHMKKIFEKRLSEQKFQKTVRSSPINIAVDEGKELMLLSKRKAQREAPQEAHSFEETGQKRRRLGSQTIGQLKSGINSAWISELPWDKSGPSKGHTDEEENATKEFLGLPTQSASKIDSILDRLKAKPQKTYSTRSKTEDVHGAFKSEPPILEEPNLERYSKVNDMGKPWSKPLTYPKTGKKKAMVEWADLERLDEGEFFNDTLIEFYLRYLQHQLELRNPNIAKKIYFFNTFFFKNLTHKGRGQRSSNYDLVINWTRGIDIFTYDYIVVPINESFHWYVVVICNLPALNRYRAPLDGGPALRDDRKGTSSPLPARSRSPEEAQIPTEQDTRTSFAELSLEQRLENTNRDGRACKIEDIRSVEDDQDMLDTQLHGDLAESGALTVDEGQENATADAKAAKDNLLEEHSTLQASPCKKKGKRKSIPPVKKLGPGQPAIVTFDSLTGTHPSTVRVIKDYLLAEADAKRGGMTFDEKQIKGMTAVGIPKQKNYCDCGPFLLGYMAKFLDDPHGFMSKVLQKSFDADKDWPAFGPSKLRADIRDLLFELYGQQEDERRESAKKSGKYVSRKSESSPITESAQDKVAPGPPIETVAETAKQISRSSSPTPATRNAALKTALPIGVAEPSQTPKDHVKSPKGPKKAPSLEKEHSVVVDSQSQAHSRPLNPSPQCQLELPSTIQDSQPTDSFEESMRDAPATPPLPSRHEGPPEPLSSPGEPEGVESSYKSLDAIRTVRSSPRSATKGAKERQREVVELD